MTVFPADTDAGPTFEIDKSELRFTVVVTVLEVLLLGDGSFVELDTLAPFESDVPLDVLAGTVATILMLVVAPAGTVPSDAEPAQNADTVQSVEGVL